MHRYAVTIEGLSPILMNNPARLLLPKSGRKTIPTSEEDAAASAYWSSNGSKELIVRADHIRGVILNAGKGFRQPGSRQSVVPMLAGALDVEPDEISLGVSEYEIDIRSCVVQKSRIMRARAKIPIPWKLEFWLLFAEGEWTQGFMDETMPEILARGGSIVGLLDFRPEHKGRFGRFKVAEYKAL